MATKSQRIGSRTSAPAGARPRSVLVWQVLSALLLLAMAGIHLYLVTDGVGGGLGQAFVLNVIGGVILAVAIVVLQGRLLLLAGVAGTLFMLGTLVALLLALTVGLFGITEVWSFTLVPETVVVESIGTVVLAVTTYLLYQPLRGSFGRL